MTQTKISARRKLELSRLHLSQQELLGYDIDVRTIKLHVGRTFGVNLAEAMTDATIERTVEGASTITLHIFDRDRRLLRSGKLAARTDINIDGLWFRLVSVNKQGDNLQLTFEDREIAILRTYHTHLKAGGKIGGIDIGDRSNITRAQFILRLIREVKEFRIPWVIPELEVIQPLEENKQNSQPLGGGQLDNMVASGKGIPHGAGQDIQRDTARMHQYAPPLKPGLRVKGERMTDTQIDVANAVCDTGASMGMRHADIVMAIMCGIAESTLHNYRGGDLDSVGVFQQRRSQGWPASRDIHRDAAAFYRSLKTEVARHPGWSYNDLIQGVQNSGTPFVYGQYRNEAERIVEAWGSPSDYQGANAMGDFSLGGATGTGYHFYRGVPPAGGLTKWGRENSWTCIQRLADEVNYRAFFVSGTFYYISEEDLLMSKPAAIISEGKKGVEGVDGEYDVGKKAAQMNLSVRMGLWSSPPGSTIQLSNMGPFNGRWIVNDVQRSLFDSLGQITIKKPRPVLPEPLGDTAAQKSASATDPNLSALTGATFGVAKSSAAEAARTIIHYHDDLGMFKDDNGRQIEQLKKIAAGKQLHNQCGHDVDVSAEMLNAIIMLMHNGLKVGLFAMCEDHSCNGGQHPAGQAVDISSLGGGVDVRHGGPIGAGGVNAPRYGWHSLDVPSTEGTQLAKQAMRLLAPYAWDLICNGVGRKDVTVEALQVDNGHNRPGDWETDHLTHIHFGVNPGLRD
jgi:hypothetical protein